MMDERMARMALTCVTEPAQPDLASAVETYGGLAVWEAVTDGGGTVSQRAARCDLDAMLRDAQRMGVRFVMPGDTEWPVQLGDLGRCESVNGMTGVPIGLWAKGGGDLAALCSTCVAMVGARASTAYGESVAAELALDLGEAGVSVVSGGAYGIDAAAHRGCLASRTPTVAVLAGGLDQPYPSAHASLFDRIATAGVLVSEFPPGEHPTRVRFLGRNRLIAALGAGTVLVEAAVRSGARNTMSWAAALNRVTMAVPGPVTSATSYTPHRLIREAEAVLVTTAAEIRELLGPLGREVPRPPAERRMTDDLTSVELRLYEAVPGRGGLAAEEIALRADVPLPQALGVLNSLADRDLLVQTPELAWALAPKRRLPEGVSLLRTG